MRGRSPLAYSAPATDGAATTRASERDAHVGGVAIERAATKPTARRPSQRRSGQASGATTKPTARRPSKLVSGSLSLSSLVESTDYHQPPNPGCAAASGSRSAACADRLLATACCCAVAGCATPSPRSPTGELGGLGRVATPQSLPAPLGGVSLSWSALVARLPQHHFSLRLGCASAAHSVWLSRARARPAVLPLGARPCWSPPCVGGYDGLSLVEPLLVRALPSPTELLHVLTTGGNAPPRQLS